MTAPRSTVASAPAKVILFGEHFVVYDAPAILAAIDRRTSASARLRNDRNIVIKSDTGASAQYGESDFKALQGGEKARMILDPIYHAVKNVIPASNQKDNTGLELELSSTVPIGIGLGSSAAACVASVASVDSLFGSHGRDWICEKAVESERMIHKNSSGADCYISTFGGVIRYSKQDGYQKVEVKEKMRLVVCSTGISHSTGDLVEGVQKFREANQAEFDELSKKAGDICDDALDAIESGNIEKLGALMNANHELLRRIGVSHRKTEELLDICLGAGAKGAKMTGAGGGGAVIALAESGKDSKKIASFVRDAGYESIEVEIDCDGLLLQKQSNSSGQ